MGILDTAASLDRWRDSGLEPISVADLPPNLQVEMDLLTIEDGAMLMRTHPSVTVFYIVSARCLHDVEHHNRVWACGCYYANTENTEWRMFADPTP